MKTRPFLSLATAALMLMLAVTSLTLALSAGRAHASPPAPGVTLRVVVADVYDGDTVTVTATWSARVRLLDCWAPEIRTLDPDEKARGQEARDFLEKIAAGKTGVLHIPTDNARRVDDVLTMGRVLGHIWLDGDTASLSEHMRTAGFATKEKEPWENVPRRPKNSEPAELPSNRATKPPSNRPTLKN